MVVSSGRGNTSCMGQFGEEGLGAGRALVNHFGVMGGGEGSGGGETR